MAEEKLELVAPAAKYRDAFLAMIDDFAAAGESRYEHLRLRAVSDFEGLLREWRRSARGLDLPPDRVPQQHYWLVRDGRQIVGSVRLRLYLNASLRHEGGHVGYDVAPSHRRKGYATLMLKLVCDEARAKGRRRVLVTCDKDNAASARVIQKNGGKLDSEGVSHWTGRQVQRYWIDLAGSPA